MSNMAPNMRGFFGSCRGVVVPPSSLIVGLLATGAVATVGVGSPSAGTGGGTLAACGVCAAAVEIPATRASNPAPEETTPRRGV
jgi:hypothetical protein